jgi:hypothetical protein
MRLNMLAAPLNARTTTTSTTMITAVRGGAAGSSGGGVTCGGVWCDPSVGCSIFGSVCMIAGSSSFFIQDR